MEAFLFILFIKTAVASEMQRCHCKVIRRHHKPNPCLWVCID